MWFFKLFDPKGQKIRINTTKREWVDILFSLLLQSDELNRNSPWTPINQSEITKFIITRNRIWPFLDRFRMQKLWLHENIERRIIYFDKIVINSSEPDLYVDQ